MIKQVLVFHLQVGSFRFSAVKFHEQNKKNVKMRTHASPLGRAKSNRELMRPHLPPGLLPYDFDKTNYGASKSNHNFSGHSQ
jgi:hypothetical protein